MRFAPARAWRSATPLTTAASYSRPEIRHNDTMRVDRSQRETGMLAGSRLRFPSVLST